MEFQQLIESTTTSLRTIASKVGENCGNISSDGESKIAIPDHTRSKKGIKRNCFTQSK